MALRAVNTISLCAGGGGLDLGIELAMPSARAVCYVEREAFACAHLVAAMQQGFLADAPLWIDVTTFNGRPWRGLVDGLIGGIPCQPHSLAGRRLGADDERDLWSDARRIIVQCGAWFAFIENVGGILTSGGAERLHRDLSRLGFTSEVGLFTAAEVGASHRRERLFWLAVAAPDLARSPQPRSQRSDPRPQCAAAERVRGDVEHTPRQRQREGRPEPEFRRWRDAAASASPAMGSAHGSFERTAIEGSSGDVGLFPPGPADLDRWRTILARAPQLEPAICRMADGMASRVDQLRMLGNGVVPLEAAYAFRTLTTRLAARGSTAADELIRMMETT